jgi:hypothetical protein
MSSNAKISTTPNVKGCCHWKSFGDPAKIRKHQQQANKKTPDIGAISSVANNPIRHRKETRYNANHCDVEPSAHCLGPQFYLCRKSQGMELVGTPWLASGCNQGWHQGGA